MEQSLSPLRNLISHLHPAPALDIAAEKTPLARSTAPDAPMTLFVRIQTERGPRTIISSGLTLSVASEIAQAMAAAGHFADFVDQCPAISVPERLARQRYDRNFSGSTFGAATLKRLAHRIA
jgi:hypothetical protein